MVKIENAELLVSGPLHNNEPTANEIIGDLRLSPIEGVQPYLVPHEAPPGVRFLGTRELGDHFPGRRDSDDPEDRVAAQMVSDLAPVAHWLGIDIHDCPLQNANFVAVGSITTPEQLGLTIALGMDKVLVTDGYPFFETFPKFVSVETARDPVNNPFSQPKHWHDQLRRIVAIGRSGLCDMFKQRNGEITYFTKTLIPSVGKGALDIGHIMQLEGISTNGETFEKVELPPGIAKLLAVEGKITRVGTWGHINNAKVVPDLGTTRGGLPRREFFGSVYVEIDPPEIADEDMLRFVQAGQLF